MSCSTAAAKMQAVQTLDSRSWWGGGGSWWKMVLGMFRLCCYCSLFPVSEFWWWYIFCFLYIDLQWTFWKSFLQRDDKLSVNGCFSVMLRNEVWFGWCCLWLLSLVASIYAVIYLNSIAKAFLSCRRNFIAYIRLGLLSELPPRSSSE